jgi:hypothetical protein
MREILGKASEWRAGIAAAALVSCVLLSPPASATQVTGWITDPSLGGPPKLSFTCSLSGTTCTGVATVQRGTNSGCSNSVADTVSGTFTGLDLSKPGPIQGTVTLSKNDYNSIHNSDGTCTYVMPTPAPPQTFPFTGTWNGTTGSLALDGIDNDGFAYHLVGSFKADVPGPNPIFPIAVSGSIDVGVASFRADIQYRAQDVGTTGSVYVFALAPATLVHAASAKDSSIPADTPAPCVLAQVSPSGTLQAASASGLQAYATGVLGSQGQAVTLLNNVPTTNVAGATIYVGYGTSSSSMVANGVYQGAVSVPGSVVCPDASTSYEGLWLKADESGWGLNLAHQGTTLFGTWFTYDNNGSGLWLVMSGGAQVSPGSFSGTLYRTTGPAFNAVPFASISFPANYTEAGTLTLSFLDANTGTMSYTVNGVAQSKPITRYIYATGGTTCVLGASPGASPNYQDLWLKSPLNSEAGWGVNLTHQGDILFATWFTYQAGGKGQWLVMSNGAKTAPGVYSGALQRTTGPAFSAIPFNPSGVARTTVGNATFTFSDANNGMFAYTVDGISQSKSITRYIYSTPTTVCQ